MYRNKFYTLLVLWNGIPEWVNAIIISLISHPHLILTGILTKADLTSSFGLNCPASNKNCFHMERIFSLYWGRPKEEPLLNI